MKLRDVNNELSLITDIGMQFIIPLVGALIGGRYLVDKFELSRKWLLLVILVGLSTGIYSVYKRLKKIL